MHTIYKAENRGKADYGWLKANYSFSFSNYYNPANIHFGVLRVLNDDVILPSAGFDTHPHDNMEIITIPLSGSLRHEDSLKHVSVIETGEVQVMSAGAGIEHSEFNASADAPLNLFQIWIFPQQKGLMPRYDQKKFDYTPGNPTLLVSPDGRNGSLSINQHAFISRIQFQEATIYKYPPFMSGNGVYMMVIDGSMQISNDILKRRDAVAITQSDSIEIKATGNLDLLIIEVPL